MSRKSCVSATIVPAASEEHAKDAGDQGIDSPLHSAEFKDEASLAPDVIVEDQAPVATPNMVTSQQAAISTLAATRGGDLARQQHLSTKPVNVRRVTSSLNDQGFHPNVQSTIALAVGVNLKRNYRTLAISFKSMGPFSRNTDGDYPADTLCVLCATRKPTSVFFPCQHMCACNDCIDLNDMSPDYSLKLEQCICPVCSSEIHIIFPRTGSEEERYWNWVLATKPFLASDFKKSFKTTGKILSEDSVAQRRMTTASSYTAHSPAGSSSQNSRQLNRRSSWGATIIRRGSAYKVQTPETRTSCLIL